MSIIRDLPFTIPSLEDRLYVTSSTGSQGIAGAGTTANVVGAAAGTAGVAGRVVDRLFDATERFPVACPFTHFYATRGSTEANRQVTLGVKLQHGDSSGGGDMADYSTQSQPDDKVFFGTARTSDFKSWDASYSTGPFRGATNQAYYDIRGAKRYIRAVHFVTKNRVTTESSGDEGARLSGGIAFLGGEFAPMGADLGPTSTSTTT